MILGIHKSIKNEVIIKLNEDKRECLVLLSSKYL